MSTGAARRGPVTRVPDRPERPTRPTSWQEALDRLEAHADRAEDVIRGFAAPDVMPWAPPTDLGPIPDEFIPRTRLLLERQQLLLAAVPSVLAEALQEHPDADQLGA